MQYGQELILDLRGCDSRQFTRPAVKMFMRRVCRIMGVQAERLEIWDYEDPKERAAAPPHLKGISAVQFLTTSNVTLHCLDDLGLVCLNLFTCGEMQHSTIARVTQFAVEWFHAKDWQSRAQPRG